MREIEEYLNRLQRKEQTRLAYRRALFLLCDLLQTEDLATVSRSAWEEAFLILYERYSATSFARILTAARGYLSDRVACGALLENPLKGLSAAQFGIQKRRTLLREDARALLDGPVSGVIGQRDRAMLHLMAYGGVRVSEILLLNLSNYDEASGEMLVGTGKQQRHFFLTQDTKGALDTYLTLRRLAQQTESEALFVNAYGQRLSRQGFWKSIKERSRLCGVAVSGPGVFCQIMLRQPTPEEQTEERERRLRESVEEFEKYSMD